MAKNDQQEAFERVLSATLARTVDFTKFAETKNAALLTFCSAWIVTLLNIMFGGKVDIEVWSNVITASISLFAIAAALCISSFVPKTELSRFTQTDNRRSNLLFFGDIAALRLPEFEQQFSARYMPGGSDVMTVGYIHDLAQQIAVNSRIARRKFRRFNLATLFCFLAIAVLVLPVLVRAAQLLLRGHAT